MFKDDRVPYRIETARAVVRCWDPRDAASMQEAINLSVQSLLPWMPWAKDEPKDYRTKIATLRRFRGDFDLDRDYVYGIFTPDERDVIGGCGLHTRAGAWALEIGYWIRTQRQNHGYATEVTKALVKAAFELSDVDNVQIRCSVGNAASSRVIANGTLQDLRSGIMLRSDYERSAIRREPIRAYGASGEALL